MTKKPFSIEELSQQYSNARNPNRAISMEKYMRDKFPFLGMEASIRKAILSNYLKVHSLPVKDEWKNIVEAFWELDEREYQYVGMELVYRCRKYLQDGDESWIQALITSKSWWDTVDYLSSKICGHYFLKVAPDKIEMVTDDWNRSENMWLNRTSLIFQLTFREKTRLDLLEKYILQHKESKEFFLQKAIGWALRQYSKTDPDYVLMFVSKHTLAPLSKKEALKVINRNAE